MAQVFSSPLRTRYTAPLLSAANLFRLLSYVSIILASFFLAYNSGGLWRKHGTYREQPQISFRHEAIVILDTVDPITGQPGIKFWSTFPTLNDAARAEDYTPALIRMQETDANRDGYNDIINMDIRMPTDNGLQVHAVTAVVFLHFALSEQISFVMNTPALIQYTSPLAGHYLQISGDLEYRQTQPIYRMNSNSEYQANPIIPDPISSYTNFYLTEWLSSYASRNDTVVFNADRFSLWRKGTASQFQLNVKARIPAQTIRYYPGFSEMIKFAWIQFASIAVLLYMIVIEFVGRYIYSEQILQTSVRKDSDPIYEFGRF